MKITIYNTLSGKIQTLKPRKKGYFEIFVCGPTVYDVSHIGHARSYIVYDAFVKFLRSMGFKVFYLQNITDVDDKIINRARKERVSWKQISRKYQREYLQDMKKIGVDSITTYAKATNHIPEIINQVKRLLAQGFAYEIPKEGIYFDISKFKNYGKLSGRTVQQAQDAVSRIDESIKKRNKGDFCLWKFSKPKEPKWKSPWGLGRPGWHIEDTAITEKFFGPQYDLHGGGEDLTFPHHEAEIAQMESLSKKSPLAQYWMHTGMLTVKGKKMSKSLKNYITIKDFLKRYSKEVLRFLVLKTHWHSPLDYDENKAKEAKASLQKINDFLIRLNQLISSQSQAKNRKSLAWLKEQKRRFYLALSNNFNTPKALAIVFDLLKKANILIDKKDLSLHQAKTILEFLKEINGILGIIDFSILEKINLPPKIRKMVKEREKLRAQGHFKEADRIRKAIAKEGYIIEDTPTGPRIKPK